MIGKNQADLIRGMVEFKLAKVAADGDDERAHVIEKGIWDRVLREIARGSTDERAKELAKLALSTQKIDFQRWMA